MMDRRQFLQWASALAVVGAAVLGACTERRQQGKRAARSAADDCRARRARVARAHRSHAGQDRGIARSDARRRIRELAASRLVTNAALVTMTERVRAAPHAHLAALNGIITTTDGQAAVTAPNAVMENQIVDPRSTAAKTQDDLAHLFFTLEDATAQTYVYAAAARRSRICARR